MKLLLTGDIHIGRSSSRIPETVQRSEFRASTAWLRMVDLAVRERVELVCLSGDITDQDNKFFEAIGPLQRGVELLAKAGIRTVAVAGNHDFDVLPRLADQLSGEDFRLMGRGGRWERFTLEHEGQSILHLDGWSFPSQYVRVSPIDSYAFSHDPGVPTLAIVHGDIHDASSPYGPLNRDRLQSLPVNGWLLGHIHAFELIHEAPRPWILYPGSPQALDPGETGSHGPWIVETDGPSFGVPEQRPLSSVWYDTIHVELSDESSEGDVEAILYDRVKELGTNIAGIAGPYLKRISLRMRLTGMTSLSHVIESIADRVVQDLDIRLGEVAVTIESHVVETIPAISLDEYATTQHTAPGALARLLLVLQQQEVPDEVEALIRQVRNDLERTASHRDFAQLDKGEVTEELARAHMQAQARSLLARLLAQTT
jgi:DNA repair exonuclease SbcCD nuclease subunit